MAKKSSKAIQVFDSYFIDGIKDLYANKVYKKSYLVIHIYNNEKINQGFNYRTLCIYIIKLP